MSKMLPEYRPFHEYQTNDEITLTELVFNDYKDIVSQAQADLLWYEAYERRHSCGIEEVYCEFVSLVRLFHNVQSCQS
jgi:hypothetical protein